jgi:hypothetical protein
MAATAFPSLRRLQVVLDIRDEPLRFGLYEPWVLPLYPFNLRCASLSEVDIILATRELDDNYIDPRNTKMWAGYPPQTVQRLVARYETCKRLHLLFGQAIAIKLLGTGDEDSLVEYKDAVKEARGTWNFTFCREVS